MIQHEITACFGRKIEAERLVVGYEDSGVAFRVRLVTMEKASAWQEEAKPYPIPEGSTARLSVVRPDRAECSMEATIEGDSTILCPLDPVACAKPGVCTAAVSIYGPDKRKITTVSWDYEVPYKGNSREVPGSGGYYVDTVEGLIKAANNAAERAEAAAKTAVDATESAGFPTFGKEDTGKLLYIAEDGKVRPLILNNKFEIKDGVLRLYDVARDVDVALPAAGWQGSESPYWQVVNIDGITPYSQVDLTPSLEQLVIFHNKDLTFTTKNAGGVVTVYAIGQRPENDYVMPATVKEVTV